MIDLKSKFLGCILGCACGDALGQPYEGFLGSNLDKIHDINIKYRGRYTDDTQLTLAIANALIEAKGYNQEALIKKYIYWLSEPPIGPGIGCLSAIHNLANGLLKPSNSGGDGTAMRVSPIGLFYNKKNELDLLKKYARDSSLLTHNHWAATAGAITIARAIAYVLNHDEINRDDFIETLSSFIDEPEYQEFSQYILELKNYFDLPIQDALKDLGLKGVKSPYIEIFLTPEVKGKGYISPYTIPAVLCSLYTFLITPNDYMNSVEQVIRGGGDTDTTAAICGAISGAFNGIDKIPKKLIDGLKDLDRILSTAEQLYKIYIKINK